MGIHSRRDLYGSALCVLGLGTETVRIQFGDCGSEFGRGYLEL